MGIPKLKKLLESFEGWQREEIKGNLIIDGHNICHTLYSFDWIHGGQFQEYQSKIKWFFECLKSSGIEPIVVMDGIDYGSKKVKTHLDRKKKKIKVILSNMKREYTEISQTTYFPPLALNVFITAMINLGIKFVVADDEGDEWMYKLANAYSCPVLSDDSDFLMYKLKNGCIPYNKFRWNSSPINAEVYYYTAFCEQFKFQDVSLRLVLPAIMGNDFIAEFYTPEFGSYIDKTVNIDGTVNRDIDETDIDGTVKIKIDIMKLLRYLQEFKALEYFIDHIDSIPCLSEYKKKHLRSNCLKVQKMYDLDEVTTLEEMNAKTILRTFDSKPVPDWLWRQFRKGNLSPSVLEALVVRKNILKVYVDDIFDRESSVLVSLSIRKCIYGMVGSGFVTITEYYRMECKVGSEDITSEESICGRPLPHLKEIPTWSIVERENLLYSILGCDDRAMQRIHSHWKLVMAATVFWARHTNASPQVVKAFILNFVVCSNGWLRKKYSKFIDPAKFFMQHPDWMSTLHSFAQWQSTYTDSLSLNELLMLPLKAASPENVYDGKLAMFFALSDSVDPFVSMLPIEKQGLFQMLVGKQFFPQLDEQIAIRSQQGNYRDRRGQDSGTAYGREVAHQSWRHDDQQSHSRGRHETQSRRPYEFRSEEQRNTSRRAVQTTQQGDYVGQRSQGNISSYESSQARSSGHNIYHQSWRQGGHNDQQSHSRGHQGTPSRRPNEFGSEMYDKRSEEPRHFSRQAVQTTQQGDYVGRRNQGSSTTSSYGSNQAWRSSNREVHRLSWHQGGHDDLQSHCRDHRGTQSRRPNESRREVYDGRREGPRNTSEQTTLGGQQGGYRGRQSQGSGTASLYGRSFRRESWSHDNDFPQL